MSYLILFYSISFYFILFTLITHSIHSIPQIYIYLFYSPSGSPPSPSPSPPSPPPIPLVKSCKTSQNFAKLDTPHTCPWMPRLLGFWLEMVR